MQTDLFEIPVNTTNVQEGNKFAFLERYRFAIRLDQVLAIAILMIMIYVLVFSFGVEKGKRFAMAELRAERAKREHMVEELREKLIESNAFPVRTEQAAAAPVPVPVLVPVKRGMPAPKAVETVVTPTPSPKAYPQGKYTIQIVTYKSQAKVDHMIAEYFKKGLKGFVIPKGANLQLCVNGYENESSAKQELKRLKSKAIIPLDAFIRMIPQ